MGRVAFEKGGLSDSIVEQIGFKTGLALSVQEIIQNLSSLNYSDLIYKSELQAVHIRVDEYDEIFYELLFRLGHISQRYSGYMSSNQLKENLKNHPLEMNGVSNLFIELWPKLMDLAELSETKTLDPSPYFLEAKNKFGEIGLAFAIQRVEELNKRLNLSPGTGQRYKEWKNLESLNSLFLGSNHDPLHGEFIDQRFIDYLSANHNRLGEIHWRKFEELTAEFFYRENCKVEIGPGRDDDGVDIRVWTQDSLESKNPTMIIQCKRQKEKIDKVVVKGLHTDVEYYGANYGLVVTTSELSVGARNVINVRGYPIYEVNREKLIEWLRILRTPGTGIVRV